MKPQTISAYLGVVLVTFINACAYEHTASESKILPGQTAPVATPSWLAGDHHVHSRFSVTYNKETNPPTPILAGEGRYSIPMNVAMGRRFGLDWIVSTDHGGPEHSKINLNHAYPELLESRKAIPEMIQYMGMEFDTPGADHSSLIMPFHVREAENLYEIESQFNKAEPWPADLSWDSQARMIEALEHMNSMEKKPLLIAHHPSRSAKGYGEYGMTEPSELRSWNDAAPDVAIGMEGAPGHQAISQIKDRFGSSLYLKYLGDKRPRGLYGSFIGGYPTMGGFDQMTARVGGFWDSMLGEGRHWWVTANSDSHVHWTDGGVDFWPGEYSKTYVLAEKNYDSIFKAIRGGKMFVTTGDLVSEVWFSVTSSGQSVAIGDTLNIASGTDLTIELRLLDPETLNHNGDNPTLERVDLIRGQVSTEKKPLDSYEHSTAEVVKRWPRENFKNDGVYLTSRYDIKNVTQSFYLRLRGTNTNEVEPLEDPNSENPWNDLWFYANPVFVNVK